jgi:hypothetical protein
MSKALSKPLCVRLPYEEYLRVLGECDSKGITISEWIERQISWANKYHLTKNSIHDIISELDEVAETDNKLAIKMKISKFKRWLSKF